MTFAVIVNVPVGAGRSTMFLAVLVVWYRSPAWVGIVSRPPPTVSAESPRTTSQPAPSAVPLKSSRNPVPGPHCGGALTITVAVAVAVPPLPSETVTLASNVPPVV